MGRAPYIAKDTDVHTHDFLKLNTNLIVSIFKETGTFLVSQTVKRLPTVLETWVRSLGWEDRLEKGMATLSSNLAWRIPGTEEPGGLQSMGSQRVRHN